MLSEFLTTNHEQIVKNSRAKVASRATPHVTSVELEVGIPLFLDQLISTLQIQESTNETPSDREIGMSAAKHGKVLQEMGFTAAQVIHDYGNVCQSITELAVTLDAPITTDEFRTLNRCLDEAMAEAVSEFGRQRETAISNDKTVRQGFDDELRSLLKNSLLAYEALKSGSVGLGGATGSVLGRNLMRMQDLIDRAAERVPARGEPEKVPVQGEKAGNDSQTAGSTKR
jgi:hypothetical protein